MLRFNYFLSLVLIFVLQSCVKTLYDEDDYDLTDGGKTLEIYLPKGVSLKDATAEININVVESITISGYVGGFNLAFLRSLSGGDDPNFLGGRNLGVLNFKNAHFSSGDEVYYVRNGEELTISALSGIPAYAFENCYVLNTIVLPDSYGSYNIDEGAFTGCLLLRYITWGSHVRKIKQEAFRECSTLAIGEPLVLPEQLEEIADRAFMETHPYEVDLPSTIENIGEEAFSDIIGNVIIRAEEPPTITKSSFIFNKSSERVLYVPKPAMEKYKVEPYVSIFDKISSIE